MRQLLTFILTVIAICNLSAQNTLLKGKITDQETGSPLPNASVSIAGAKGVVSDKDGNFKAECTGDSAILTIQYIGYETFTKKVACGQEINATMRTTARDLSVVEITATSSPNKKFLYQPASIDRIGETEIKRGAGILMDDAVNTNMPGVYMQRRTFSAGQQFNIRGYGNGIRGTNGVNSNFDGQGYKVYLNGIPVTDAEGITLMDDIDFGAVGNVEVVKGPSGTLYGQAIAGVVNLKTIRPQPGNSSASHELLSGSYGLLRNTTSLQIGKERASFIASYGKQHYDGFMAHTGSDKDFFNFYGDYAPNQKQSFNSYIGYSNSYDERNGELTKQQYETFDYSGNLNYIKNNAHSNVISFRSGVAHTYRFSDYISNTTALFGTSLFSNVSSAGGWTDKSAQNYGFRTTFDTRFALGKNITISGITGAELQRQNAQTMGYPMLADSFNLTGYNIIGSQRSNQYTISRTASLFSEWTLSLPHDISVTAGLGWSALGIELNDRFYVATNNNPSNPNGTRRPSVYKNSFDNMISPHIALNKVLSGQISVYASWSKGYKAPVSSYFFIPLTGEVLTDLRPETGIQYEAGTKGSLWNERLNYQLAAFYTDYRDKMTTIAVPNPTKTATSYVYVANAGEQKNTGIELSLRGVAYKSEGFIKTLSPFFNMAYSSFKYGKFRFQQLSGDKKSVVEVDFSNKIVAGVPPVTLNAGFDLATTAGLYMNATYSYRDQMYYTSDNLNQTQKYQLLNAKIGYSNVLFGRLGIDAYAGVNNITGNQNYVMVFLNQLPDAYLPAPYKANYFGGVKLKYNF